MLYTKECNLLTSQLVQYYARMGVLLVNVSASSNNGIDMFIMVKPLIEQHGASCFMEHSEHFFSIFCAPSTTFRFCSLDLFSDRATSLCKYIEQLMLCGARDAKFWPQLCKVELVRQCLHLVKKMEKYFVRVLFLLLMIQPFIFSSICMFLLSTHSFHVDC